MPGPRPKYVIEFTTPQVAALTHVSASDTAPFAHVQRARILLLAHQRPDWNNHQSAQGVASCVETVRMLRPRRPQEPTRADRPRVWASRTFPSPRPRQRVATVESRETPPGGRGAEARPGVPSTIRRWGSQDRLKLWHDHAWQDSKDPHVVEKASSVLASVAEVNQHPKPN
jgi:hypothetical protein